MQTETTKAQFGEFVKLPIVLLLKQGSENLQTKDEYLKTQIRINPFHISAYFPSQYEDEDGIHTATVVLCAGARHCLDMEIERFDEIMQKVDRGINFKELR